MHNTRLWPGRDADAALWQPRPAAGNSFLASGCEEGWVGERRRRGLLWGPLPRLLSSSQVAPAALSSPGLQLQPP